MPNHVHATLARCEVTSDSVDLIYQALRIRPFRCCRHRPVVACLVHDAEPRPLQGYRLRLNPQTYACGVKRGDQDWLNFVNTALHEAMTGVEFGFYAVLQDMVRKDLAHRRSASRSNISKSPAMVRACPCSHLI